MTLTLHFHPLSSYCWKVLVGLYELDVAFDTHLVDLSNPQERAELARRWPIAKFPVLHDAARDRWIPESSIILEYVDHAHRLIPADRELTLECRLRDRIYDAYIHTPMQKLVDDRLRPANARDPLGVERARALLETAYPLVDDHARVVRDDFTLADCSAMPALYYANQVLPFGGRWRNLDAYFARLVARPSVARVLREAAPYLEMFPT